jgi:hypothetical protein
MNLLEILSGINKNLFRILLSKLKNVLKMFVRSLEERGIRGGRRRRRKIGIRRKGKIGGIGRRGRVIGVGRRKGRVGRIMSSRKIKNGRLKVSITKKGLK